MISSFIELSLICCFYIFHAFFINSLDEGFDGYTIMSLSVKDLIDIGLKNGQELKLFIFVKIKKKPKE